MSGHAGSGSHHAESWHLRQGLEADELALADVMRPMVQKVKHSLSRLAVASLAAKDDDQVAALAGEVRGEIGSAERLLTMIEPGPRSGLIRSEALAATAEMRALIERVAEGGRLDASVARKLRGAYRRYRTATGLLWHSELVPESSSLDHWGGAYG